MTTEVSFSSGKKPPISTVIFEKVLEGANNQETTTTKLGFCHGIFSDQAVFRRVFRFGLDGCT